MKVGETISLNIELLESSTNDNISTQCSNKGVMKFAKLLGGFQQVSAWPYEDIHGFDPGLIQHTMKPSRKKQGLVNSTLKATLRRELRDFIRTEILFFFHPEWVSNCEPASNTNDDIRTYLSLQNFRQAIMRNPLPPLSMEMFLQQVVESRLEPLLDSLFGYNKIKVEGENIHKTTFITN